MSGNADAAQKQMTARYGNGGGFKRAIAMFAAISEALRLPSQKEQREALDQIGPYYSRGKGGRHSVDFSPNHRYKARRSTAQGKRDACKRRNQLRYRRRLRRKEMRRNRK